ncbi:alpha-protein kinase 3 isoform X2 [Corythoichthys intestinalis]|uniref:alpha-protein kinase 3 isoform X2 n=1 Tax=Corythoichthys intestinalis TaxID=161448 RepID=UPI0025A6662F|nr:alpha-protein kinase 3 isoform X2 [Corythoichthys intestinalis]
MTSRRPMTRSFSANGRTSSFSEEDSSSSNGRTETRNNYLSSVRPENRSTLCTVMAQLTEDIQPCFETTLKSKAVSENCNVKFTCVVTGYPVPELKWYKDDMEMDRYCGLPKYEILKNGKIHSLHIYNCTLDDAAIYQVSASNSKGIVSCSGVLEVGTMSEFKIHQRFFAKLKQKAEKKRRDLEEQNKKGGTIQTDESRVSPEAPPRKRPVPPPEPVRTANESEAVKQQRAAVESNGVHSDVKETASAVSLDNGLKENIPVFEELVAKKKPKITNGVDAGFSTATSSNSRDHVMGNGSENRYDGGISLAQFLSETLQSQTAEENENSCEVEKPQEMDVCIENESTEKEGRHDELPVEKKEHETAVEKDLGLEREKEKERLQEVSHQAEHSKHFRKAVKDHDHHNIQSSLSTMLHTVKDFFFGKGKRDSYEDIDNKDKEQDQNPKSIKSSQSLTPPSYRLYKKHRAEVDKAHTDQSAPMEIDTSKEPSKRIDEDQQSASKKLSTAQERQINHAVKSPAIELPLGNLKEPRRQSNQETGRQVENMERSASEGTLGPGQQTSFSSLQVLTEAKEKHTGVVPSMDMVPSQAADTLVASTTPQYRAAEVTSSPRRNKSFPHTSRSFNQQSPLLKENQAPPFSVISALETSNLCVTPTVALQRGEIRVGKVANGDKPHKEVKYATSPKKSGLKSEEKSKELPNVNRPKVTVLTPPSIEKDKPDKDVNCTSKKLCMETEEKLKEVPDLNKPKVAVLMPPSLEEGKPGTGVNYSSKKSVKTAENLKEISHPVTSTTKVAVLTPPSMGEGKIDKKVNYPSTKSVETEPELKELPCPEIKRPEMAVFTPSSLEEAKPDKEVEYPSKQCVKTEEKLKELPCPKKNRPEITVFTPPMLEEGKSDKKTNYPSTKSVETEEKLKELKYPNKNGPEEVIITPPLLEKAVKMREIKAPDQTLVANMEAHSLQRDDAKDIFESVKASDHTHISNMEALSLQKDNAKDIFESVTVTREISIGFPPDTAPKMVDLKMWSECMPSLADESERDLKERQPQSSESSFKSNEEREERIEVVTDEQNNLNNLKEQKLSTVQPIKTNDQVSEMVIEMKPPAVEYDLNKESAKIITDKKDKEIKMGVFEEASNMEYQTHNKKEQFISEKVPLLSMCMEDTGNIKEHMDDKITNEYMAVPRVDVIKPQCTHNTLPLTILALKKIESEPSILEKHLKPQTIARDVDSSGLLPKQTSSNSAKLMEPVQSDEKKKTIAQDQTSAKVSQQLSQVDNEPIPQINVSCSDDKEDHKSVTTHVQDTLQPLETSTVPLFVVPPISVTCHESEGEERLHTHYEGTETDTLVVTESVRQSGIGSDTIITSEKSQHVAEHSLPESISSLPNENLLQRGNDSGPPLGKTTEDNVSLEILKAKPLKQAKIDTSVTVEDLLRNRAPVERLTQKPPTHPSLSPGSIRKFMAKAAAELESDAGMMVPVITVDDRQSDKADEDTSGGSTPTSSTPTSSLSCESSPRLKRRDSLTLIRSATPEELASGARRKIFMPKPKEDVDSPASALEAQNKKESPYMSPSQARRAALLQAPVGQNTPPMERRSPLMNRRKATLEVPKVVEEPPKEEPAKGVKEEKVAEKKFDPLKAPQVIRKIRGEPFPDASGHLKLWCQFFNVLSDSSIKWFRDEEEILEVKRSAGDETQVALAIVLAASQDCGVYGCTIKNEYGTDTTDFLLSVDILSDILLRDDLEVGEEIEMTPLLFTKGLANSGNWGDKYFGRIMTEMANIGEGCRHKASRVKVIYGLNPIYESGSTCIIKVPNPIPYGTKQDSNLIDRNLEMTKQECKIQNMIREYCKIFAAEARVIENFGSSLEVIPQYLMYRPANSVPYATVEVDLEGVFLKYSATDAKGNVIARSASEMEQKCSTFQHWIHQWTHGNLLITRMEGVETKITNIRVVTKTRGYQSLTDCGSPEVFEHFPTVHQCNYYCGLLGLRPLKTQDQTTKVKGSRSPNLNRKLTPGSGSPQPHRKGHSPQMARKANESPKVTRKVQETGDNDSNDKLKSAETTEALEMR